MKPNLPQQTATHSLFSQCTHVKSGRIQPCDFSVVLTLVPDESWNYDLYSHKARDPTA